MKMVILRLKIKSLIPQRKQTKDKKNAFKTCPTSLALVV
jgi:hypothetical protein